MITKQTKAIGGIALTLFVLTIAGIVFAVAVITNQGEQLQTQIALLADVAAQERNINEVQDILETSAADRQAMTKFFLTESDTIDFLSSIEDIARRQGLELTTESLAVQESAGEPTTLAVTFSILGAENVVYDFIKLLEALPYGSYLTKLQILNTAETMNTEANTEAQVTVAILLLPIYD